LANNIDTLSKMLFLCPPSEGALSQVDMPPKQSKV